MKIDAVIHLIETLRGPGGCPWDREQTPKTISLYLVEEIFELLDAIESGGPDAVCEELGDVLFHILFITRLFRERGDFDIQDVVRVINEKMIRRHPHVFGNDSVSGTAEIRDRWHEIKMKEKNPEQGTSILDSVPTGLPALMRAYRVSERAARAGFDWNDISGVMEKVEEEWSEFQSKLPAETPNKIDRESLSLEFGDILFTLVNVARFAHVHPETALTGSIQKFEKRFRHMERALSESGKSMDSVSAEELDR
ncbi:nucleoside triphosphate pyrophosphohydrolase, partial [Thermodesulfobacteriota bacterium]